MVTIHLWVKWKRRPLLEALENGYRPHLAFRDIHKVHQSNRLFDAFVRALPDKRRPDFNKLLQSFGLPIDYSETDLLRVTGRRLATDPYEFVAPIYRFNNHSDFDFYVAGWRYYDGDDSLNELKISEVVKFELDMVNPKGKKAVVLLTTYSDSKFSYVPAFYKFFMFDVIRNNRKYKAKIEDTNTDAKPQLKVNISVVGQTEMFNYNRSEFDIIEQLEIL